MNKTLSIAVALALAGLSGVAAAEDMGLEFSGNVAMTTDYVWRGVSQTDEDPAIQGGFDVAHASGAYAGIWGSNIEDWNGANMEIDYYLGWSGETGPVSLDIGYLWYTYPDSAPSVDFEEMYIGVSKDFEAVSVGATYSYDFDNENAYWDLSGSVPVGDFSIAAHYGITDADAAASDYKDWSIGASTEMGGFGLDLTYFETDDDGETIYGDLADSRVVFTISKSL